MNGRSYEARDASPRYAVIGLASLVACIVTAVVVAGLFVIAYHRGGAPSVPGRVMKPPPPRLEVAGGATRAEVEARGMARLTSWGWTDRQGELAHIPIDRAMAITAAHGWADQGPGR